MSSQQVLNPDSDFTEVASTSGASSISLPTKSSSMNLTQDSPIPTFFSASFQQSEMSQRSESVFSSSSRQSLLQPTI